MMRISLTQFQTLVEQGVAAFPRRFFKKLKNVAIVVQNHPTKKQLREQGLRKDEALLGLYEGIPQIDRWQYGNVLPDKITIFKDPILKEAETEEDVRRIVAETAWHEIAHHFGMEERAVQQEERKRLRKQR